MKFLLDGPLPDRTTLWLRAEGHDAVHIRDIGLATASDSQILQRAHRDGRIILTMDLDFPHLLSMCSAEGPGVILFRLNRPIPSLIQERLELLLGTISEAKLSRAITVIEEARFRFHRLPTA